MVQELRECVIEVLLVIYLVTPHSSWVVSIVERVSNAELEAILKMILIRVRLGIKNCVGIVSVKEYFMWFLESIRSKTPKIDF